eukprot:1755759-Amphidinium_carterae.1
MSATANLCQACRATEQVLSCPEGEHEHHGHAHYRMGAAEKEVISFAHSAIEDGKLRSRHLVMQSRTDVSPKLGR